MIHISLCSTFFYIYDICITFMQIFPLSRGLFIRLLFVYNASMFPAPSGRKTFVATCKRCRRDVPSGREDFPFQSVAVECPLCGELRRYLPSEVFLGRPDQLVTRQQRNGAP